MINKYLKLYIMTPFSTEIVDIEWLRAETNSGEFLILPNHAAMLSSVSDGESIEYKICESEKKTLNTVGAMIRLDGKDSIYLLC